MKKITTGHEVFDSLIDVKMGSLIAVIDETGVESIDFLEALLSKTKEPVYVLSPKPFSTTFNVIPIKTSSLNELNIEVSRLREKLKHGIIIHRYLPNILMREDESSILWMLEHWSHQISEKNFAEFFLLPNDVFPSFEKKMQSIMDCVIFLKTKSEERGREFSFSLGLGAKPQYRMKEFQYKIEGKRLLIRWGDIFTDRLPETGTLKKTIEYIRKNINNLKISPNPSPEYEHLSFHDKLLLSQLAGMHLLDIQMLFPDRLDEIIRKIAYWNINGVINLEKDEKIVPATNHLRLINRIALAMPTSIATLLLRLISLKSGIRFVPFDTYMGMKEAAETFCRILFPHDEEKYKNLYDVQSFFPELVARKTALEHVKKFRQHPTLQLDPKHIPKFCFITLYQAFRLKPKIRRLNENVYELILENCPFCRDIKSTKPVCDLVSTTLTGVLPVLYKERFTCYEVECKAMGHKACKFILKMEKRGNLHGDV